jgi:hypothetical protein
VPTVSAADGVLVIGGGTHSCGKWLESKNDRASRYQFQQWVSGYISGSNYSNQRKQSRPPDIESVMAFIDQYCMNNPLHAVASAAAAVVQETGGPKAEHKWKR